MGFYRQRTKCQFLHGPTYGPANDDAGAASLARILQPANNNDAARQPSLPCCHRPAAPSNRTRPVRHSRPPAHPVTQPAQPDTAGRIHSVTTFSHDI